MRVELRGLGKSYDGGQWAVRGLDLDVPSGTIVGLIGPNGAGKSTTLRMLAALLEPSEGSVLFDGAVPGPESRRRVGFLGDGNPLYRDMSPSEYLRLFGQCFKMPAAELERAIDETLDTFSLRDKADTPAAALSKGMRQRLLVARCLLHGPELLVLDEPADGLDPLGRADLRRILLDVRSRGVTVVVSSHILRELDDLCDSVAILQQGRLVAGGEVGTVASSHDLAHARYRLRVGSDPEAAVAVLARHPVLVEPATTVDGRPSIAFQLRAPEARVGEIVAELAAQGVVVLELARERTRLEDIYARLSDHHVN